jgi:methionine synthase I (cobalamin-dependent)
MESKLLKIARIITEDLTFIFGNHGTNDYIVWVDKKRYNEEKEIRKFLKDYKEEVDLLLNDKIDCILVEYDNGFREL